MFLQGKVAAIKEQIENKISNGITSFELQLFEEDTVDEVISVLYEFPQITINTVHTALNGEKAVCLDGLDYPTDWMYLQRACYVAQYLGERQDKEVGVVLHNTFTAEQFKQHPSSFNTILERVKKVAEMFPKVYLMIENISPYNAETLCLYNGTTPQQMLDVITLFESNGVHLYVTLDLCHSTMTHNTYEKMLLGTSLSIPWEALESMLTYKGWFSTLNDYIANIHVAKCIGDGHGVGKHGAALTSVDKAAMSQLYEVCKAYSPHCFWTIEVQEDDYNNPVNLYATYNLCKHVMGGDTL